MTSSIMTDWGDWDVSSLMFWRIFDLATEVGEQVADTDEKRHWVKALAELLQNEEKGSPLETYSPDVDVFEILHSQEEAGFWSDVLFDVAGRVFLGEYSSSATLQVKTETVWAAYDLAALLRKVANRPRQIKE